MAGSVDWIAPLWKDPVTSVHKEEHAQIIKIIQSPGPQHIQAGHTQYFLHTVRCSSLKGIREAIVAALIKKNKWVPPVASVGSFSMRKYETIVECSDECI